MDKFNRSNLCMDNKGPPNTNNRTMLLLVRQQDSIGFKSQECMALLGWLQKESDWTQQKYCKERIVILYNKHCNILPASRPRRYSSYQMTKTGLIIVHNICNVKNTRLHHNKTIFQNQILNTFQSTRKFESRHGPDSSGKLFVIWGAHLYGKILHALSSCSEQIVLMFDLYESEKSLSLSL